MPTVPTPEDVQAAMNETFKPAPNPMPGSNALLREFREVEGGK